MANDALAIACQTCSLVRRDPINRRPSSRTARVTPSLLVPAFLVTSPCRHGRTSLLCPATPNRPPHPAATFTLSPEDMGYRGRRPRSEGDLRALMVGEPMSGVDWSAAAPRPDRESSGPE